VAERNYVDVNIHDAANADRLKSLAQLPTDCSASADRLEAQRSFYEAKGVFSPHMIDGQIAHLRAFAAETATDTAELVRRHFNCG
jgi:glutamine synthetase